MYCAKKLRITLRDGARKKAPPDAEISRAADAPFALSVFNVPLPEVMMQQQEIRPGKRIPYVVEVLTEADDIFPCRII